MLPRNRLRRRSTCTGTLFIWQHLVDTRLGVPTLGNPSHSGGGAHLARVAWESGIMRFELSHMGFRMVGWAL